MRHVLHPQPPQVLWGGKHVSNLECTCEPHALFDLFFRPAGRANLKLEPQDWGRYPWKCPRYHRFRVTHKGNFTFDTCSSMMPVGLSLYSRTANLSKSEPRMTSAWDGFKRDQLYQVPLYDDSDQQYGTVSTGLVKVQPDILNQGLVDWINNFPLNTHGDPLRHPQQAGYNSINGCLMSQGAHRTYFLDEGDYFLETTIASSAGTCKPHNVKMECSGGAETASPAESDPGWSWQKPLAQGAPHCRAQRGCLMSAATCNPHVDAWCASFLPRCTWCCFSWIFGEREDRGDQRQTRESARGIAV